MGVRVLRVLPLLVFSFVAEAVWGSCDRCEGNRDVVRCSTCKEFYVRPILPFLQSISSLLNSTEWINAVQQELLDNPNTGFVEKVAQNDTLYSLKTAMDSLISEEKVYLKEDAFKETVFRMAMALHQVSKVPNGDCFFRQDEVFELMNLCDSVLGVSSYFQTTWALTYEYLRYFNRKGSFPEFRTDYFELYKELVPMLVENLIKCEYEFFELNKTKKRRAEMLKHLCCCRLLNGNVQNQQMASEFDSAYSDSEYIEALQLRLFTSLKNIKTVKLSKLDWSQHVGKHYEDRKFVVLCIIPDEPKKPYTRVVMVVGYESGKYNVYFFQGGYMEFDTEQGEQEVLSVLNDMLEPIPKSEYQKLFELYRQQVKDRIGIEYSYREYMEKFINNGSAAVWMAGGMAAGIAVYVLPMLYRAWTDR